MGDLSDREISDLVLEPLEIPSACEPPRSYPCPFKGCGRTFETQRGLARHIDHCPHAPEDSEESTAPTTEPYFILRYCPNCGIRLENFLTAAEIASALEADSNDR